MDGDGIAQAKRRRPVGIGIKAGAEPCRDERVLGLRRDPLASSTARRRAREGIEVRLRDDEPSHEARVASGDGDRDVGAQAVPDEIDRRRRLLLSRQPLRPKRGHPASSPSPAVDR